MNLNVLGAVYKRNFAAYFASPTGYVFLCVFVALSGFAAFWPAEFFNSNLASLHQLNKYFPYIMLVFIPAITMAIWADERRQGTDELLLTIPGHDLDIVLGKYLATVAVYTVSLLFSLGCNLIVLEVLSNPGLSGGQGPDVGLFLGTYFGYWLIGSAMLAVGMVASFLTHNLTVAYILGALFNAPLVFITELASGSMTRFLAQWGISRRFYDFGQGVITISGLVYFLAIAAIMAYLSMALIGRRHWLGGSKGGALVLHYVVRVLAMVAVGVGLCITFTNHDKRLDVTNERLSSLSPKTIELLDDLKVDRPVLVEAFVSPEHVVPELYVQSRLSLLAMLHELQARGGAKVKVTINETDQFTEEAARAEQRFGITPRQVFSSNRGVDKVDHLFMGVAFTCGTQKPVILPFIDRGISAEYELVRSLCTVTQQKRKKVGILQTDAQLYGQFNFQSMQSAGNWPIVDELEKQYDVVQVDPTNPITEKYDVLLAVQPSSLGPQQLDNFVAAIEHGQPTAIFEDPFPAFVGEVPATSAPRQPPGGMNPMMMGMNRQQQQPKGEISKLWQMLGVDFAADQIVWQKYNPYPKASQFPDEFVFVDQGAMTSAGLKDPFSATDKISTGLQHMLFPFPGALAKLQASGLEFIPLARTGDQTGTVQFSEIMQMTPFGPRGGLNERRRQIPTKNQYVLAAQIRGKIKPVQEMADEGKPAADKKADQPAAEKKVDKKPAKPQEVDLNVVIVADIDMLSRNFFRLREQGDNPEFGMRYDFDNVTFVLNTLDVLAGDERFVEIRKRRPKYRTLSTIEDNTRAAKEQAAEARERFIKSFNSEVERERKALDDRLAELRKRKNANSLEMLQELSMLEETGNQRIQARTEQLQRERDQKVNKIDTDLNVLIRKVQDQYKRWAVLLPPIPPLLIGLAVFFVRRAREREGVARSRLK